MGRRFGIALSSLSMAALTACSSTDEEPAGGATGGQSSAGGQSASGGQSTAGGASAGGSAAGGAPGSGGSAAGSSTALIGTFQVQLVAANPSTGTAASTRLVGKVSDGPTPPQIVWSVADESGDCVLEKPRVPFCDPSCGAGVCVDDGECQSYPAAKSVGTVTVSGIANSSGAAFAMEPIAGNYQPPAGLTLIYPGFDDDSTIGVSTSGGDFAPFSIETKGIQPLTIADGAIPIETDKPALLLWTAANDPKASVIHVKLDISHHGGTKGMIQCDTDDDGSLDVPAALVTKLLALGVAGFPTVVVTRRTTGKAQTSRGVVELDVESPVERSVTIPGLVSCNGDEQCPSGQTCQPNLSCG